MDELFHELGTAGVALIGALAVMGSLWASMYGFKSDYRTDRTYTVNGGESGTEAVNEFIDSISISK